MDEKKHNYSKQKINKYDTAIGLFYAVASFISILFILTN